MKDKNICVLIDSEEKRLKALEILKKAGEEVFEESFLLDDYDGEIFYMGLHGDGAWGVLGKRKHEITLEQLEELLIPNYVAKEVSLTLDQLKEQAEKLGLELVEKKREIKVGDFGLFWDDEESNKVLGFIMELKHNGYITNSNGGNWKNFRHLTKEEKENIQNNW